MICQIQIKSVYGENKAYPFNHIAGRFADIAGTKTLTRATLRSVLAMGVTLQVMDQFGQVARSFEAGSNGDAVAHMRSLVSLEIN